MSPPDVPPLMNAVVTQPVSPPCWPSLTQALMTIRLQNRTALVQQVHVAIPGNNEILVKVKTVAINPTDWKRACVVIKPPYHTLAYIPPPSLSTDLKFICSKPARPALPNSTS